MRTRAPCTPRLGLGDLLLKLIHNIEAPHQLFDLGTDPEELNNLFESNQNKAKELSDALADIRDPESVHQQAEAFWQMQVARHAEESAG